MAVYFDSIEIKEIGFDNPLIFWTNLAWVLVVAWIIWDLLKGKDIKLTLILVGLVILASIGWDTHEYGFGLPQLLYVFELVMFIATYFFVNSNESKSWRSKKLNNKVL
jgi:hypothetical protein